LAILGESVFFAVAVSICAGRKTTHQSKHESKEKCQSFFHGSLINMEQ